MKNAASSKLKNQWLGIDTSIALGLIATVIFFLASGYMAWLNLNALDESNQRVVQTHVAIVALDELLSNVQDAETGQRGFLLTNNEDYLEPFSSAVQAIPLKLQNIAHLTGMNPGQQQRLALLKNSVDMKIAELQETIDLRRSEGLEAALKIVVSDRGKEEMDSIRAQIANMAEQESEVRRQRIAEMKSAQQTALNSTMSSGLLGILLTLVIGFLIRRATVSRRQEEWLQSGELALAGEMMGDQPIQQLGESLLKFIVRHVGGVAGAAFAGNGRDFQRIALYGVPDPTTVPSRFSLHDGLLGQIAAEGRPMTFGEVPDGYLSFGSALGSGKPKNIVIFPGAIDGKVNAVIEIGFLNPVEKNVENFLRRASEAVAIAVQSAKYRSELQNLLEETQRQSEELQTQSEELRVSNEELEEQGRALKESQIRLEQQQAELEQTNSQLEEQAQELEAQRDNLERVNAAVEVKARELARASQYKSDFLANMSHELRTPLNSSLILAKLLADNPSENLTPEQVKFAQTIQSSGNDLLNLINDILDLSKIEAGHVEIKPETVVIETVSKNLRRMFEPMSAAKKLDLVIEFAPDLPSTIVTDPFRLEQVLKNLVSNAVKFTDVGSVRMQVGLSGSNHVYFAVTDTGIGIAAEQQQTIFEAFHQADGTISRRYGGTGLGLSISRQLVLLLGGDNRSGE